MKRHPPLFLHSHIYCKSNKHPAIIMKAITCVVIALACVLGLVVADDYYGFGGYSGGYGGASYVPLYGGHGGARSGGYGGFLALFLFLIFFLFLFNNNNTASVSVVNLTG